jgi:hypothetical protein
MKTFNGNDKQEKRRKRYITPMIYLFAQLTLVWIVLSVVNISFDIQKWATWSYGVFFVIFTYLAYKTFHIYKRQKDLKLA